MTFDIAQFFPLLNHILLLIILDKAGFNSRISSLFSNYSIDRRTQYIWNNFISSSFRADVGVGQNSTLSSILFAFYIALIFYIFEKRTKNPLYNILVSTLSFMDDGFFIHTIEYTKSEVFYFSRMTKNFNSSPLNLGLLGDPLL